MTRMLSIIHRRKVVRRWAAAGRAVPPPHEVKQLVVLEYGKRFRLRTLVETGTYLGTMLDAVLHRFDHIYSIELDEVLFADATRRFAEHPRITIIQGDSGQQLPLLLRDLKSPTLFWLDGHWSEGITAKGDKETPILAEIEAIVAHSCRDHVVLIDDARLFVGKHDYPSLEELRAVVMRKMPESVFEVRDDIIRIHRR
jgi:hypothetical protein